MSKSIEQEYKTLLTFEQFKELLIHFHLDDKDPLIQTNTYYDTHDGKLLKFNTAFRLRNFEHNAEWTIKQRVDSLKSIELTEHLVSPITPPLSLNSTTLTNSEIISFINKAQVNWDELHQTYQMATERWSIPFHGGELCLDRTNFGNVTDYELEFEFNHKQDENNWLALLSQFNIEYKLADKKIARAKHYQS